MPESAFVAITIGRLIRRKAVDVLIRALSEPGCEDVHLLVVGEGPRSEDLKRLAESRRVQSRVHFTGFVEEERKWQLLHSADAYVSASMHEGFGLVFIEGMIAGLPVVACNQGGQCDFLEDGVTGFLVPAGDGGALSNAIARLAVDSEQSRRIGKENQRRARRFGIENCASAYEGLFERVVAARRKGAQPARGTGLRAESQKPTPPEQPRV